MRFRYICTSCSEVIRWARNANWSSSTLASTNCSWFGVPNGGWAATGRETMATKATKISTNRFMVPPSQSGYGAILSDARAACAWFLSEDARATHQLHQYPKRNTLTLDRSDQSSRPEGQTSLL